MNSNEAADHNNAEARDPNDPNVFDGKVLDYQRAALQRAYRFAWAYGKHLHPCLLAADINLPDGTPCSCGYDAAADQLMDDEEALGLDFWQDARPEAAP